MYHADSRSSHNEYLRGTRRRRIVSARMQVNLVRETLPMLDWKKAAAQPTPCVALGRLLPELSPSVELATQISDGVIGLRRFCCCCFLSTAPLRPASRTGGSGSGQWGVRGKVHDRAWPRGDGFHGVRRAAGLNEAPVSYIWLSYHSSFFYEKTVVVR